MAKILKHFGIGLNTRLEKQLKNSTEIDKYPNDETHISERYKNSIFRRELPFKNLEQYQDYSLKIQIDEIINIGGIYIGLDKLTHFTASGYLYYRIYNLTLEQLESEEAAMQMAISMGKWFRKCPKMATFWPQMMLGTLTWTHRWPAKRACV